MEIYSQTILIIDSDIIIHHLLKIRLAPIGYRILIVTSWKEAKIFFSKEDIDLVIIDIFLSKLDGYEVCRKIRETSKIPIIILTAFGNITDRIRNLEFGADDYILKPFSPKELEARIKSVLRRYNSSGTKLFPPKKKKKVIRVGDLSIDMNTQVIQKKSSKIKLTNIEFRILELLFENAGKKLSRETILDNIWGYVPERSTDTRIVDVHISRLRSKIEEDSRNPDLIITERGIGYTFQEY